MKLTWLIYGVLVGMQAATGPVVLTRDQIDEVYYDGAPRDLASVSGWLGLYVGPEESFLATATVTFATEPDGNQTVHRIRTDPAGAKTGSRNA